MKRILLLISCLNFVLFTNSFSQVFTAPYSDNFESGSPGWSVVNSIGTEWQLGTPSFGQTNSSHSGSNCWDINLDSAYGNSGFCELLSPAFNFTNVPGIKISFWYNMNVEAGWDGMRLEFATDTNIIWNVLGTINMPGAQNWYNTGSLFSTGLPAWSGNSNGWAFASIILPNFSGNSDVYFRFIFASDASVVFDGFSIDDFSIEAAAMNTVTGSVYIDANSSGTIDAGDPPVPNLSVNANPNGGYYYAPTNSSGSYSFFVDSAVTTVITPVLPPYATAVPANHTVTVNGSGQLSPGHDFLLVFQPGITDPEVSISSTPVRPGFAHCKTIHIANAGTTWISGTVSLTYDASYSFQNASSPATIIAPNTLEFAYSALLPGAHQFINCYFLGDTSLITGSTTTTTAIIYPVTGDANNGNNYDTLHCITVNSLDPNNKLVDPEGDITTLQVTGGMELDYTINFQNTGTAPATYVNIFDVLDDDLDITTFEVTGSSHLLNSWNIGANRQVQFTFNNINLPDSTSNEPASHGFVSYRIRPSTTLGAGTQITNSAAIVFDFNAAVITNTITTTVIDPLGVEPVNATSRVLLYPNPSHGTFYLKAGAGFNRYQLINAIGQKILEGKINNPGEITEISTGNISKGLYLVVLTGNYDYKTSTIIIE